MAFISQDIKLCQIIIERDAAFRCIVELGQEKLLQFRDMHDGALLFQRTHIAPMRRCNALENSLAYIQQEIVSAEMAGHVPAMNLDNTKNCQERRINELETVIFDLENDVRQFLFNEQQLLKHYNNNNEFFEVLKHVELFFADIDNINPFSEIDFSDPVFNELGTPLTPLIEQNTEPFFIAGTIESIKRVGFERVLWRACRRTAYLKTTGIVGFFDDAETGKPVEKSVFIVFVKGSILHDIVDRVCQGFGATQYSCPKIPKERAQTMEKIRNRQQDLRTVIKSTTEQKKQLMHRAAVKLADWQHEVFLLKTTYHTLNMFTLDHSGSFLVGEAWVPTKNYEQVEQALDRGAAKSESGTVVKPIINPMDRDDEPPTYYETNKFTKVFQAIVDSYGVPCYKEMNPAPYTIITFPFLFAVMFGDVGHAVIMLLPALFFIYYEKKIESLKIKDEIFNTFFSGRYMILLMSLFSIYTGMLYNDAFSKSMNIFGSQWRNQYNITSLNEMFNRRIQRRETNIAMQFDPSRSFLHAEGPYPFGMDPIWNIAMNRLNFVNSMKMKASVIIGIAQMTLGVFLSLCNYIRKKDYIDVFTTFIPQLIFLSLIFIYLCAEIFVKWIFIWVHPGEPLGLHYPGVHCAPSLLIGLINMCMLRKKPIDFYQPNSTTLVRNCHQVRWYPKQNVVEPILVITAFSMIPIMFFGKYLVRKFCIRKKSEPFRINRAPMNIKVKLNKEEIELLPADDKTKQGKKPNFAPVPEKKEKSSTDAFVHQSIHTIEFVLGCISHTASYLRLWALSLAHSQLSEVMWHMILAQAFHVDGTVGGIVLYAIFFIFFLLTASILVLMEGLSAFLHALRLHWVEFQSKFYVGTGHLFVPFSYRDGLEKYCFDSDVY